VVAERAHLYARAAVGARVKFEYKDEDDIVILSLDEMRYVLRLLRTAELIAEGAGRPGFAAAFKVPAERLAKESSLCLPSNSELRSPDDAESTSPESPTSTATPTRAVGNPTSDTDARSTSSVPKSPSSPATNGTHKNDVVQPSTTVIVADAGEKPTPGTPAPADTAPSA
jgi:hypothetical protein